MVDDDEMNWCKAIVGSVLCSGLGRRTVKKVCCSVPQNSDNSSTAKAMNLVSGSLPD